MYSAIIIHNLNNFNSLFVDWMGCKVDTMVGGLCLGKVNYSIIFKISLPPNINLFDFALYFILESTQ